jgi:hypothetical protein
MLASLMLLAVMGATSGAGQQATVAEQCQSSLLLLPSTPDPNTDVLFNMQTRKIEEALHLAAESGRTLVEPNYVFGARNWTWFEDANHNQLANNQEIHRGVLGTIEEPLSSFFELAPLDNLLHRPITSLGSYTAACTHDLDLVIRFWGHSGISSCDSSSTHISAWGVTWNARRVTCLHASQLQTLGELLEMSRDSSRLALEYLPPKFVEQRQHGWRWSPERLRVREALQWAAPLILEAETFIDTFLAPFRDEEGEGEGKGVGGLGNFVAVHWRRGDRCPLRVCGVSGVWFLFWCLRLKNAHETCDDMYACKHCLYV